MSTACSTIIDKLPNAATDEMTNAKVGGRGGGALGIDSGLDVATPGVANATWFYLVATNFSRLVAMIFVTFFGKTFTYNIPLNG